MLETIAVCPSKLWQHTFVDCTGASSDKAIPTSTAYGFPRPRLRALRVQNIGLSGSSECILVSIVPSLGPSQEQRWWVGARTKSVASYRQFDVESIHRMAGWRMSIARHTQYQLARIVLDCIFVVAAAVLSHRQKPDAAKACVDRALKNCWDFVNTSDSTGARPSGTVSKN